MNLTIKVYTSLKKKFGESTWENVKFDSSFIKNSTGEELESVVFDTYKLLVKDSGEIPSLFEIVEEILYSKCYKNNIEAILNDIDRVIKGVEFEDGEALIINLNKGEITSPQSKEQTLFILKNKLEAISSEEISEIIEDNNLIYQIQKILVENRLVYKELTLSPSKSVW